MKTQREVVVSFRVESKGMLGDLNLCADMASRFKPPILGPHVGEASRSVFRQIGLSHFVRIGEGRIAVPN
jgi:hypothetical protein